MALKRSHAMMSSFSMASMTDIIFLLLIFFMVTSTFVFPTALNVNLPQSTTQTALKPVYRVYIDSDQTIYTSTGDDNPVAINATDLDSWFQNVQAAGDGSSVALYADENVPYGGIVSVLNSGAQVGVKVVLATRPVSTSSVQQYLNN